MLKYFFAVRIVGTWNSLLAALLCCNYNVENFEIKLDCLFNDQGSAFSPCKPLTLVSGSLSCVEFSRMMTRVRNKVRVRLGSQFGFGGYFIFCTVLLRITLSTHH